MELKDLASVSGRGGLFKILKPTRTGVILESLDDKKSKFVAGAQHRVSALNEISIYTQDQEGSRPLIEVFQKIYEEFKDDTGLTSSSDPDELKAFLKHIVPEYDENQVYVSDIKKLISWYNIIVNKSPDILVKKKEEKKKSGKKNEKSQ